MILIRKLHIIVVMNRTSHLLKIKCLINVGEKISREKNNSYFIGLYKKPPALLDVHPRLYQELAKRRQTLLLDTRCLASDWRSGSSSVL
jgi:hypothetical protein